LKKRLKPLLREKKRPKKNCGRSLGRRLNHAMGGGTKKQGDTNRKKEAAYNKKSKIKRKG